MGAAQVSSSSPNLGSKLRGPLTVALAANNIICIELYIVLKTQKSFHADIVEEEIGGVAIYRPFGEFRRANSYCPLYGAQGQGQRQAYF
ncbi:hypothetical protein TNCV_1870871 [Trichonephila clavipes]|nr:hypothetical protein TNCV_1870871 [Trichonephila clavipes]